MTLNGLSKVKGPGAMASIVSNIVSVTVFEIFDAEVMT